MLVDADPQGHLTMGLGFPKNLKVTLKSMMENIIMGLEFDPKEAVLHHEEGMDLIPSNKLLAGMDMSLFTVEDREKVLKEYLELLKDCFIKSENRQIIGVLNSFSCFLWKTFAKWAQYGRNQARAFLFCKPVEFRFPIRSI